MATLFGLETDHLKQVIRKLWLRKGEAVVETNYKALDAGIAYVNEQVNGAAPFVLAPAAEMQNTIHVSGNQATGLGAIAGGVQFFAGYPITPASDVMEYLAAWLPQQGGHVVQAEDEIAAVNMLLGASYAGARGHDHDQRSRPLADGRGAGAGDDGRATGRHRGRAARRAPRPVCPPVTSKPTSTLPRSVATARCRASCWQLPRVEDCFWLAIEAFNLSEKYQMPVILMTDTVVAVRTESIERPDLSQVQLAERGNLVSQRHQRPSVRSDSAGGGSGR